MNEHARTERLSLLAIDYRVALAHSPIDPRMVDEVKAGWLRETEYKISYGFVILYRGQWVYLWGSRTKGIRQNEHGMRWFDHEPSHLYDRNVQWEWDLTETFNGTESKENSGTFTGSTSYSFAY